MKIRKSSLFAIIILVNGIFFALGMIVATWFYNQNNPIEESYSYTHTNNNTLEQEDVILTDSDLSDLEDFYLPLFIAHNDLERNGQAIMNSVISYFEIKELDKSDYEEYIEDESITLYSKDDIDNVMNELFGNNAQDIISSAEETTYDKENEVYVIRGNDSSFGEYAISIADYNKDNDGNIVIDMEYCEYSNSDLEAFIEEYTNNSTSDSNSVNSLIATDTSENSIDNESLDSENVILEKATKEFITMQEKESSIITIKENEDYTYSKYQLVSFEIN